MTFSEDVLLRMAIFVLGLCGFWVARHIYKHKNSEEKPLVCPINFDCHGVVHSDYSKFLGMHVDILGMVYYALISIAYLLFIFMPSQMPILLVNFMIGISAFAFLFSLYLIGVQIFALKKGCSWCIVSAVISVLIFIFTLATYHFDYVLSIFVR